jgi:hypothetical protein
MLKVTKSTYGSVNVSSDGRVGDSLAAVGIPSIGHCEKPKGQDQRLEGLHFDER